MKCLVGHTATVDGGFSSRLRIKQTTYPTEAEYENVWQESAV